MKQILRNGQNKFICFHRIMDIKFYVKIIENHIPEINAMLEDDWRLQQNNNLKYISHLAKEFLKNNPVLNLIENLWPIIKGNVEHQMPKNLNKLKRFMERNGQQFQKL